MTPTWAGSAASRPRPARVDPVISRAAAWATGRPVTFSTNGTERLARGLASSTYSRSPLKALDVEDPDHPEGPTQAGGRLLDGRDLVGPEGDGRQHAGRVAGWIPASSMCSITPQTSTWPVASQRASTSTSTASSGTGRPAPAGRAGPRSRIAAVPAGMLARAPEAARRPAS